MMFQDASRLLNAFLQPVTLDQFLDEMLVGGFRRVPAAENGTRQALMGADPAALLAGAFHLAPKLTFHSANPTGAAPSLDGVHDAAEFRRRLDLFHARNYSVRFPELRPLSPPLDALARAFEMVLHQPVSTSAFWSQGGMRSPVHFDDHDLLVVQLRGIKRWYVAQTPSALNNAWPSIPAQTVPELGPHHVVDVVPGDLLYLPRGTLHSVDANAESLHVAIGFTPLTLREAVIAALDHLSDLDRAWRTTVGGRLAFQLGSAGTDGLLPPVIEATSRLATACRAPGFLNAALQRRSARVVGSLQALPVPAALPMPSAAEAIRMDSILRQCPMAFCHLTANAEKIDLSYPGGHVYIHRGALEAIVFMVNTPSFVVGEIPGAIEDAVRLSLAAKLVEIGFLELPGS